jgi:glycosyltransferase involved in cell wall biosynthesis
MKILIATGLYPPESGGPATYTKLLEERLPTLGFEVSVLPFSRVRHLLPGARHVAYFFKCRALARKVDVVFAQDTVSVGLPAALAAWTLGKKFVVRVPGDYAWEQARQRFGVKDGLEEFQTRTYGLRTELLRAIQNFVVTSAARVIVPSEYMKRIVSGWGVEPVRIYNGINLAPAYELPKERPQGFLVVSSGRRVPWKGFEALERVVSLEPDWRLFIAHELPLAQALGWVKAADVYVLNSTYEGLSHQMLEAMALGTPIVATRVGGNPELIEDKIDGLLIPPNDDEALHTALKDIKENKETARARAQSARAKVGRFSIDTTIAELAKLLQTL